MPSAAMLSLPFGLAAGSAAGVAFARWPAGLTLGRPARSRCDRCAVPLRGADLIPVVAWLWRHGRCRACGTRIGRTTVLLEASIPILVAAALVVPPIEVGIVLAFVGAALVLATALDLSYRWIPDRLTLSLAAVVLPVSLALAVDGAAPTGPILACGLGVPAVLALIRTASDGGRRGPSIGGGDVKLLAPLLAAAALVPAGPVTLGVWSIGSAGSTALVGLVSGRLQRGSHLPLAPFLLVGWTAVLAGRITAGPS